MFLRDEELTRYTVTSGFETELNNGQLELTVVNGSERAWKNLPKVWDYLHEEEQFTDYVQKEIQRFLKKRSEQ
ncbi:hypothetical protein DO021_22215 [Desulfobacter hydrogenophilus]|uniref:Uncharacterized protein n=1 Tax=Desulfobacter hydrogenophilus TaxID=2291 RepID=A0A328F5P4_9BACT|nr:hypothetical protein DO021_22215 [Desulfobacter hydrogenophilus]